MSTRQIVVIAGCLTTGIILWMLPRTALSAKTEAKSTIMGAAEVEQQVEMLKKELPQQDLVQLEYYEKQLKEAAQPAKAAWYDSLAAYWDRQMRPGIAAEYVYFMASSTGSGNDWLRAGKRFLGLASFFSPEEKTMLAGRAVECLEKAYQSDSLNQDIQTNLGIAYTQSGTQPMKGIALLLKVTQANPANFEAQFNMGLFSMQSGQYDKAIGRFKTAMELRSDLPEIRLYLSEALTGAGQMEEARKTLQELKNLTRDTMLIQEVDRRLNQIQ